MRGTLGSIVDGLELDPTGRVILSEEIFHQLKTLDDVALAGGLNTSCTSNLDCAYSTNLFCSNHSCVGATNQTSCTNTENCDGVTNGNFCKMPRTLNDGCI